MMNKDTCLVVLSGGQDSVTCLGIALARFKNVHAISFVYNQKHEVEIHCADKLCLKYGVEHYICDASALAGFNDSALIRGNEQSVSDNHKHKEGLPASFVPARNATFLTLAHGYAQKVGASVIYTGVCQTDYSGYPDCREEFINHLELTLNKGYETEIQIRTPLMHLTKAQTFKLAEHYNFLDEVLYESHTCYEGEHNLMNDWGYGCGKCPACELRAKGWEEYKADKSISVDYEDNNDHEQEWLG